MVEMSTSAPTMIGRAEPKTVAQRLDKVEVFGLTRVVLPSRAAGRGPDGSRGVDAGARRVARRSSTARRDRQTYKDARRRQGQR